MTLFAVTYSYTADSSADRAAIRPAHMEFLAGLYERGRLIVSGPTEATGPVPGALLIISGASAEEVDELMSHDPFAQAGYVERTVRSWDPKFGGERLT